jgi:anti-sigma factor RsiW
MVESRHTTTTSLSAYVDGELPPDQAAAVAEHLATCFSCSSEYETMLETVGILRTQLQPYAAPDVLRARIRTAIASTPSGGAVERHQSADVQSTRGWSPWRRIASWAAVVLLAAALGSGLTLIAGVGRDDSSIASEVFASHLRSLMPDHLTDVRSSDQHNVKPWFNGRLDYSPNVPRLDEQGFPLLGGRIDYIDRRPVAVVVYGRRQHLINVFSWPTAGGDARRDIAAKNGYTMIHWRARGAEHWVLSDLNAAELQGFATLFQAADSVTQPPAR